MVARKLNEKSATRTCNKLPVRVADTLIIPNQCTATTFSRSKLAAEIIFRNAASVSGYFLVFRPQSGFTQRFLAGMTFNAFSINCTISSTVGTRGEWIS